MSIQIINGQPWSQQGDFNSQQITDITGWGTVSSLPIAIRDASALITKDRVYVLGFVNSTNVPQTTTYTAPINSDGTLGSWSAGTSLSAARSRGAVVLTRGYVYHIGGLQSGGTPVNTVMRASVASNGVIGSWSTLSDLPVSIKSPRAVVTKNRIYLIGASKVVLTATIAEDGIIGTFTDCSTSDVPEALLFYGAYSYHRLFKTSTRLYFVDGGSVYFTPIGSDGTLGTWQTATSISGYTIYGPLVVCTEARAYLLGGVDESSQGSNVVKTAPISAGIVGTWVSGTSLPVYRKNGHYGLVVTSGKIHLFGGEDDDFNSGTNDTKATIYSAPFLGGLNDYLNATWYEPSFWTNFKGQSEIV